MDPLHLKKTVMADNGDKESEYDNDDFEKEDIV